MYLLLFVQGLTTTPRHLFSRKMTVSNPEARPKIPDPLIYRGVHRLNRDEQGRVKCVACFLCATACPAHCIDIVARRKPLARPRKISRRASQSTSCGVFSAACAKRPARSTPSS